MKIISAALKTDIGLTIGISALILISIIILRSIAPFVFPGYFIYLAIGIAAFIILSQIDFDAISVLFVYFYIWSILFLLVPLLIGQVTRGAVRWIPIGPLTIQPAELVRPFLLVFFARFLTESRVTFGRFMQSNFLFAVPFILIIVQPSLGVAILTAIGYVGVLLASSINKRILVAAAVLFAIALPLIWQILAPYQKERILPLIDPSRASYNSIQSMISVGSGKLTGRGLGKGVETQLSFLPEKQTDFIFASISEEMGFVGAVLVLVVLFFVLFRIISILERSRSVAARAFITGIFLTLFVQVLVHIGMNMGMFPITGLPLPLVSAGGSSLVATMTALGMVIGAKK